MTTRLVPLAVWLLATTAAPAAAQLAAETIVRGLDSPVAVVPLPDQTSANVFLIVEQGGVVRVARDGELAEEPFLDLRDDVVARGEQGLLGLALAPDYAESGRLYVNFTNRNGDTVVARFTRDAEDPLRADPASRFDLRWPDGQRVIRQPFSNHNGGHLVFGPDGYLYVGLGDGGSGGDPMHNAQNPQSLLGKMLRIDVDVDADDERGYRIPEDNPFLDGDPVSALPEIWAFGLRNPWRYSFDNPRRGGTASLLIGDVGQNSREEIDFEPAGRGGRNYGWRLREGRATFDERLPAAFGPLVEPIHDYGRSIGASVTGGFVYRGAALDPSFNGRYFFADFTRGRVFSIGLHLDPETGEATASDEREHTESLGGADTLGMVSTFAEDHDGELLIANYQQGTIVRIVPDLDVVPERPELSAASDGNRLVLTWQPGGGDVEAVEYIVERLREGAVVDRRVVERQEDTVAWQPGDCVRVRGVGPSGSAGPPSIPVCREEAPPEPAAVSFQPRRP